MRKGRTRQRRTPWGAVLAAGAVLFGVAAGPEAAHAAGPPSPVVLAGPDRFATAAQVAFEEFPHGASTAVLAVGTDAHAVDALTAGPLAAALHAPLLLAESPTVLGSTTTLALQSLGVENVILVGAAASLGNSGALPPGVAVRARLSGPDRFATAAAVAGYLAAVTQRHAFPAAFVASGAQDHLVDALAAGPFAAEAEAPILLRPVGGGPLPPDEATWLSPGATVYLVGAAAATPLPATGRVVPLAGADRYATNVALDAYFAAGPWSAVVLASASPDHFTDALVAGPLAAAWQAGLVLVPSTGPLPGAIAAYLGKPQAFSPMRWAVVGQSQAVPPSVQADVAEIWTKTPARLTLQGASTAVAGKLWTARAEVANAWGQPLSPSVTWTVSSSSPWVAWAPQGDGGVAVVADQSGTYTVTAQVAGLTATATVIVHAPHPATPDQIALYAASPADLATAKALAQAEGIPADQILTTFAQAWQAMQQGSAVVVAIGSPAANALAYDPCGWSAGSTGTPAQGSPYPGALGVTEPTAGYFVDANGNTAQDSAALAAAWVQYALTGILPTGSLPAAATPAPACQGTADAAQAPSGVSGASEVLNGLDADQSLVPAAAAGQIGPGTPYRFAARYLGGPCYRSTPLTAREAAALKADGLLLVSLYSGANRVPGEAVCGVQTQAQGTVDGERAVALAEGVGQPPGTAIYLDLEPYQTGTQWLGYVEGWTEAVAAQGYLPGVYSGPHQLQTIASQPWGENHVLYWVTAWNYAGVQVPPPDPTQILPEATLWQYAGDVPGPTGITDTVDLDAAQGTVGMW
ncbi:MAG: cell wall-binding repeat-containing protein [Firmicutes bacterium]|nr:cell wall-binding repeat-containing protein [Alicyclobacillaceae bacterium]MCL6496498.1 cell wall-binding repeat-containing protein [Bacillota bacterium]